MSQIFNKQHLISFGNYLLSGEREQIISDRNVGNEETFEEEIFKVNDFDFDNWIEIYFEKEHEEFKKQLKEESFDFRGIIKKKVK